MIPFIYRLRERIEIKKEDTSATIISGTPLHVIRVSLRAARILELSDGTRSIFEIARELDAPEEEIQNICHYFLKRGIVTMELLKDGPAPTVSVIIPVKDRRDELKECLTSLFSLDYPSLEVIVVDDGSKDGSADVARTFPCIVLSHSPSRGQSYCRNLGARHAGGEILAFIDSDCVASPAWLKELVPYFQWEKVAAVGGYVDGYYEENALERYEKTCSPLTMGKRILIGGDDGTTFYTPTCNLLVRARVYKEAGGITENLHVGEDVDLCWRMRKRGYTLLYIPAGTVYHKHRSRLLTMLKRRMDYGTSEAILYRLHGEKKKLFPLTPLPTLTFVSLALSFVTPLFLILAGMSLLAGGVVKWAKSKAVSPWRAFLSTGRSQFSFCYFASFHLIRYYLILFLLLSLLFPPLALLVLAMLLLSSSVDYLTKKPRVAYPTYLFLSTLDHLFYQAGVVTGCVREGTFGSYRARVLKETPVKME